MRAGEQAVSRAADTEAIAHFSIGLREAEKLPEAAAERMFLIPMASRRSSTDPRRR
jgi:hypothetical protein